MATISRKENEGEPEGDETEAFGFFMGEEYEPQRRKGGAEIAGILIVRHYLDADSGSPFHPLGSGKERIAKEMCEKAAVQMGEKF